MDPPASTLLAITHDLSNIQLVELGLATFAIGIVGGMVGIALGVVRLPVMTAIGVDPLIAAGDNLAVSFLGALGGSFPHYFEGKIVWRIVFMIGVPAIIGAFIGGRFAGVAPVWALLLAVAILVLWSGIVVIRRSLEEIKRTRRSSATPQESGKGTLTRSMAVREGLIGIGIGVVGGAVGLALGVLRMPALIAVLKMDPLYAAGTNLAMTVLIGSAGFAGHLFGGRSDWMLLAATGPASAISMFIGARLSGRTEPGKLRLSIGIVLVLIAPALLWDAVQRAS